MHIKIYQIDTERDTNRVKFEAHDRLEQLQQTPKVDSSLYDEVFDGYVDCQDLEGVFRQFNTEGHPLHRGHSLSMSDIVEIVDGENGLESGAYYCDRFGFQKVGFDSTKTQKSDNLMRVVYVEPHKPPYVAEIEDTLEGKQRAVKGFIEPVYIEDDGTCLICNEEAKLIGMEGNRRIGDGTSIIAGPFFVCGLGDEDFRGLTDEEVVKYMDRFKEPDIISPEETQADTGFVITGWNY